MAGMLFNGKTSSWSYTIPAGSGAKDFAVTITGCGGENRTYYTTRTSNMWWGQEVSEQGPHLWEGNTYEFKYGQGNTGASVYVTADNLSMAIPGGEGSQSAFARRGSFTNKYHHDRIGGHWEKEAYQVTETWTERESYYADWWNRWLGKKSYRNVERSRQVTKYRNVYKDDYRDWTERIWNWQSIQNQVKPTQAGQSRSFLCSASNKISFSSSQEFNLCVWEL